MSKKSLLESKTPFVKPVRILLTEKEIMEQEIFKTRSGMTYNAFTDRAIAQYVADETNHPKKRESKVGKTLRERYISESTYKQLMDFCAAQKGRTISAVVDAAVQQFMERYNDFD